MFTTAGESAKQKETRRKAHFGAFLCVYLILGRSLALVSSSALVLRNVALSHVPVSGGPHINIQR